MNETTTTTGTAETLLDQLVERRLLELEGNIDRAKLAAGMSQVLSVGSSDARQRASALAQWLLGQSAVAELYASDEELAAILEQW